jgi:hypothetical protein
MSRGSGAAARYFWADWTAEGGCPHMCRGGRGVGGDFFDGVGGGEFYAAAIFHRDVQGAQDQLGALQINGVAHERVDDFHQRRVDRLFVLKDGDRMKARLRRSFYTAVRVLVEVAELLSAESDGAATDSGDFDMSAGFCVGHRNPVDDFLVVRSQNIGGMRVRGGGDDDVRVKFWK